MKDYKLVFSVNGKKTEAIIRANDGSAAKKIIQAQYAGANIYFYNVAPAK